MVYDTIVVGLGSAGTTAASTLAQAGKKVLALEAMDRVGGRVNTVPFGDGLVELGAEWIHGTANSRVYDTAIANNIDVVNQTLDSQILMSDGSTANTQLIGELMDFATEVIDDPPPVPEPLGQYITRRVIAHINEKYPQIANDTDFIESFLFFMDLAIDNLESSNNWNDVTTLSHYEELKGHQYASWHRHGYKTFFEILLNKYKNGPGYPNLEVLLNKEVSRISWPQAPAQDVTVSCTDGSEYKARSVIVTVSLGVLKERHNTLFSPAVSSEKITAIEKMSIGVVDKVVLSFEKVWWPKVSFNVFLWKPEDRKNLSKEDTWISYASGPSFGMGSSNTLTLWFCGDVAKLFACSEVLDLNPWTGGVILDVFILKSARSLEFVPDLAISTYCDRHDTLFAEKLPSEKLVAIESMSIGVIGKIILTFPRRWWSFKDRITFFWSKSDRTRSGDDAWLADIPGGTEPKGHAKLFYPELPQEKVTLIDKMSIGVVDKIVLLFDKVWWPSGASFFGFLWDREARLKIHPKDKWMTRIYGATQPLGNEKALTLWTSGNCAKLVETLPEDVVRSKVMELLRRFMGRNTEIPEPTAILRSSWYKNPYTRGSYTYDNILTPQHPNAREDLGKPLVDSAGNPRVLFAGEATNPLHFSTVHGASETGYREAMRLLAVTSKI